MSGLIRAAVIGVGHFGRHHAAKYAAMDDVALVAVADRNLAAAEVIAGELGTRAVEDFHTVLDDVEMVSIAVPTDTHFDVAMACLDAGKHVLVEKPIAGTLEHADQLIARANEKGLILQVGHIERFSESYRAIAERVTNPLYIESYRIAPFNPRITDVNVILDLMIHDIDMVLALVKSRVDAVDAVGAPVITQREDIANTRLRFANGCVANITASRVSAKTQRTMRIFQPESYTLVDFQDRKLVHMYKGGTPIFPGYPGIQREDHTFEAADNLEREVRAFVDAVRSGTAPAVDGPAGREALDVALRIGESLHEHLRFLEAQGKVHNIS